MGTPRFLYQLMFLLVALTKHRYICVELFFTLQEVKLFYHLTFFL
jgi:hypothetical protein